ncbi:MAG: undecaprenyl-diphosphatase UppP [Actinobacteria bacterium]|nr:undecaprenyl-diphosphatase UppP [Actinomycetota bacterium]
MTVFQAIVLGLVQGLTEFLPVSSSGHLVLTPEILGIPKPSLAFDVMLHLATVVAVGGYFARDIYSMAGAFLWPKRLAPGSVKQWRRLGLWLVIGTVPAGLAGVFLGDFFESLFESTLAVGAFLLVTSILMVIADYVAGRAVATRSVDDMGLVDALIVGCFQALAIAPGLSRSGATISGGMFLGLDRAAAARFSFLLSVPAIGGAGLLNIGEISAGFTDGTAAYVAGAVAAILSGLFAVHFMLRFLRSHRLRVFSIYTAVLGVFVIILSLL